MVQSLGLQTPSPSGMFWKARVGSGVHSMELNV